MADFRAELSLLFFCLLNIAVFSSAWFFASRRMTRCRSQAILDAALLGYAVQYAAVGVPGILHCLNMGMIAAVALILVLIFVLTAWKTPVLRDSEEPGLSGGSTRLLGVHQNRRLSVLVVGLGLFVSTMILLFAHSQANLPVISNDAMTYHFTAAAQWLQQGKISLFQTWFFNPANTYSPLAGSMFIAWMIAPFGSDVVARFVEVPALFCVGIAMYRLCREIGARVTIATLIAGASVLARPIFAPSMMGKDDLFVAFFFIAILVALSQERSAERWGAARFGIALGLLLATKYTAMLTLPILLLAIDGSGWRPRGWITGLLVAIALAGPWYLRNWILTGNPLFPVFSLFTTARSDAFHSVKNATNVVVGSAYGLPVALAVLLGIGWIFSIRSAWSRPMLRSCVLGSLLGFALFFVQSPFPEVRFVLPIFLLLFACSAFAIQKFCTKEKAAIALAGLLFAISLVSVFNFRAFSTIADFSGIALTLSVLGLLLQSWAGSSRFRWAAVTLIVGGAICQYSYVHWTAYCRDYRETLFDDGLGYDVEYPDLNRLWRFANQNIPADATIAYTNMYLIYPLLDESLQRRLIYAPTRQGVKSIADLGWLGSNLSGEQLVPAAVHATVASPDRATWLQNLKTAGAKYLIIGKWGTGDNIPPEAAFAASDPSHFYHVYDGPAGSIYQIKHTN